MIQKSLGVWIGVLVTTLIALFLIKYFNIAYPVNVRTSQVSSELSVVGEGRVDVTPDSATVNAGMNVSNAATIDDARRQVDTVSNALVDSLTKLGIDKKDIKTTNYSVNPNYVYDQISGNRANGYNANISYTVTVRKIDMVNQVVDVATKVGANQVNGINYNVEHPEKYREQARNAAIQNARDQAQKLAQQLGIQIGRVTNIVESNSSLPGPIPYLKADMAMGGASQPNIQPGQESITSTVTLYFEKN